MLIMQHIKNRNPIIFDHMTVCIIRLEKVDSILYKSYVKLPDI